MISPKIKICLHGSLSGCMVGLVSSTDVGQELNHGFSFSIVYGSKSISSGAMDCRVDVHTGTCMLLVLISWDGIPRHVAKKSSTRRKLPNCSKAIS